MHETIPTATLSHLFNVIQDLFCALDNFPTMCLLIVLPAAAFPCRESHVIETGASLVCTEGA